MQRSAYPYVTTSDGISVFDRDNQYRPLFWDRASNEIDWLNREDNGLLLTLLDHLPSDGNEWSNPIIHWTEDERMEVGTTVATAANASATTLVVEDSYIAVDGSFLVCPEDGEIMVCSSAPTYGSHTLNIARGQNGTVPKAKAVGDHIIAMPALMSELDDIKGGVGRLPGESQFNYISIASKYFEISKMQANSTVFDNWGQVPKAQIDTILDMRRELGYGLLFQGRHSYPVSNKGQMYISGGFCSFMKDGWLDLGEEDSNLTWPVLNDYLEARFEPDASSLQKTLLAGPNLFRAGQKMMRDLGREDSTPYYMPELKTMRYTITTDSGYSVTVLLDRFGLNPKYGLSSWGILMDTAWIKGGHYNGMQWQWIQNVQDNDEVMKRKDVYIGSFSLMVKHQECHGVIRGGTNRAVTR